LFAYHFGRDGTGGGWFFTGFLPMLIRIEVTSERAMQETKPDPSSHPSQDGLATKAEPQPSAAEVAKALESVAQATKHAALLRSAAAPLTPANASVTATKQPWFAGNGPVVVYVLLVLGAVFGISLLLARGIERGAKQLAKIQELAKTAAIEIDAARRQSGGYGEAARGAVDSAAQSEAEKLLGRLAAGEAAAADQVFAQADEWTGKTQRTPQTEQFITAALNLNDPQVREAALAAQLAIDGMPRDESGVAMAKQAVGNPNQRAWALWMLGALGNRGIDPEHTAKIIESYLGDPDARVRASAVDALSLVGSDETIPMLLDRFRNDPAPTVQERAACDIAQSGMYTHAQRMMAAATLVGWVNDALLSAQQRGWTVQALGDISGSNFGADGAAWKSWYDSAAH
jgi:HEAT repeats